MLVKTIAEWRIEALRHRALTVKRNKLFEAVKKVSSEHTAKFAFNALRIGAL